MVKTGCQRHQWLKDLPSWKSAGDWRSFWAASTMRRVKLLAIETSTEQGSIAVWREGEVFWRACPQQLAHSETVLPLICDALDAAGLALADLHAIAFAAGPGSFTSLRVACGIAQGLAFVHQLPLLAIGTLEAMAAASGGERVIVALDARMGEVYYGLYRHGCPLAPVTVCAPSAITVPESSGWLACGNGLTVYPRLRDRLSSCVSTYLPELMADARSVARLAALRLVRGETIDAAEAAPLYVRDKVALTVAERLAGGGKA